jgi:hypothetical protein
MQEALEKDEREENEQRTAEEAHAHADKRKIGRRGSGKKREEMR